MRVQQQPVAGHLDRLPITLLSQEHDVVKQQSMVRGQVALRMRNPPRAGAWQTS